MTLHPEHSHHFNHRFEAGCALVMMAGVCGVAATAGFAAWCWLVLAAAALAGCLGHGLPRPPSDREFLAQHGIDRAGFDD